MDAILTAARKWSAVSTLDDLTALMGRFEGAGKTIKKHTAQVDAVLAERTLNSVQHSYALLQLLLHRLESAVVEGRGAAAATPVALLLHCHDFFSSFTPFQIQLCWPDLFHLAQLFTRLSLLCHRPSAPLLSFSHALRVLDQLHPNALTPLHSHFVQLVVRSKHYHFALPLLSVPLYSIRHAKDGLDALLYLEFWYYSGVVWSVYKKWSQAVEAFQMCLTVPGTAVSAVQVAAYKKLILVSLLHTGEVPSLAPRVVPQVLLRHLEPLVQPYADVGKAFTKAVNATMATTSSAANGSTNTTATSSSSSSSPPPSSSSSSTSSKDSTDLSSLHTTHRALFVSDRTHGLVKQLLTHLTHLQIQRLTSTYLTLPLSSLSALVRSPPAAVERWLSLLIERGAIRARVDGRLGLVSFLDEDEGLDEVRVTRAIDRHLVHLLAVRRAVELINRRLAVNPIYIAKNMQTEKEEGGGGGGGGESTGGGRGSGRASRGGGGGGGAGGSSAALSNEDEQMRMAIAQSITYQ